MHQPTTPASEAKPRHWTTLGELRGDEAALAVKHSEFYSKPEEFFTKEEQGTKFADRGADADLGSRGIHGAESQAERR
ncbi:MAG: hypothetical protein IPK53_19130 [bacterium]|nr:hypothetical protein [bacterium]